MWNAEVVSSEGDLMNDDYLQENKRIEKNDMGEYFETCEPRFWFDEQVQERIDHINNMIKRLEAEKKHLERYGTALVGKTSYADILLFP